MPPTGSRAAYRFSQRAVLLLIRGSALSVPASEEALRARFQLTAAESRLARAPASYARINGEEPLTRWLHKLTDVRARSIILARLRRIATSGVLGDYKSVGKGVGELRIDYGPGYRVYAHRDGPLVLLLLAGSTKADQQAAIAQATAYLKEWKKRNA